MAAHIEKGSVMRHRAVHHGKGAIDIRRFPFPGEHRTTHFIIFDMPPGSSEGAHVHGAEDPSEGRLDEYYYVISGSGIMRIDGEMIEVTQGDFIYTPTGTYHGIENTAESDNLKVMITIVILDHASLAFKDSR